MDLKDIDTHTKNSYLTEIQLLKKLSGYNCIIKLIDAELSEVTSSLKIVLECGEIDFAKILARHKVCDNGLVIIRD